MWKSLLTLGGPVLAGVLGWLLKGVKTDGSADLIQTALVALFGAGSAITIWVSVAQAGWKKGGGKLDGKLDAGEIDGILTELLHKAGLTSLDGLVDQLAPKLAETLQGLTNRIPFNLAMGASPLNGLTATQLVDSLKAWDIDEAADPTQSALYATVLDLLSDVVKSDDAGSKAAAEIRAALHRIAFPAKKLPVAA